MSPEAADPHDLAATISREMVRIHTQSYGQGASSARTFLFDDVVLTMIDIELLPGEKVLVESGRHELVQQVRHGFQQAIGATFKAAVERATGRNVIAFVSETHIDPHFTIELFRLDGDAGGAGAAEDARSRAQLPGEPELTQ